MSKATSAQAELFILAHKTLGKIEGPLFGQFIELVGRCINDGLYEPSSPLARSDGLRADVVEALRELRPTHIRYPGGCAVSYFDWQELVGPQDQRPRARLYRGAGTGSQAQSTAFGIPEAWALCRELGAEMFLTINAHTQSPEDAANLVEYLNGTKPTRYADLRRAHGREEPYGVKLFGLGNEIYGNWQAGQKTAAEYAGWCVEAIRQMKSVDPTLRAVVCGLGRPDPEWDRTVLFRTIGLADMISVHNYFGRPVFADSMAASRIAEQMLKATNAIIDEAMDLPLGVSSRAHRDFGALPVVSARPGIAFDEWNVWYRASHGTNHPLEEVYNYTDALTVASLMHVVLRNTCSVHLSNISLAVNTVASILTDPRRMVRQTTWHAQRLLRDAHAGRVVETFFDGPTFRAKHERFFCGIVDPVKAMDESLPTLQKFDDLPALDAVVSVNDERRTLSLSLINKLEKQPLTVKLNFRNFQPTGRMMKVRRLTGGKNLLATNTLDHPNRVSTAVEVTPLKTTLTLPPASLAVIEMSGRD
ncbi:MAG: alpha-L-arabinofuranosidase C-terminal domain-containing protein [Verrucomicrobiia bacterium]